jgi:orotate phosphoribosyltransferase-like protein
MKTIETILEDIRYPIGRNMHNSMIIIEQMAEEIDKISPKRINLICMGSSGAIMAGIISGILKHKIINIYHVKKDGERSHQSEDLYINKASFNVIIDDFISTGNTIREICKKTKLNRFNCLCVSGEVNAINIDFVSFDYVICKNYNLMYSDYEID